MIGELHHTYRTACRARERWATAAVREPERGVGKSHQHPPRLCTEAGQRCRIPLQSMASNTRTLFCYFATRRGSTDSDRQMKLLSKYQSFPTSRYRSLEGCLRQSRTRENELQRTQASRNAVLCTPQDPGMKISYEEGLRQLHPNMTLANTTRARLAFAHKKQKHHNPKR